MLFKWVDYCEKYEDEIESWMDDDTRRFSSDSIKEDHEYYILSDEYENNINYFCKVIFDGEEIIAVIIILRGDEYPVHVNPIIVNPKYRNKGYGTKILFELINNIFEITGFEEKVFHAVIFGDNNASIRTFEKVGFVLAGTHIDGDCGYWVYPDSELENCRNYYKDYII